MITSKKRQSDADLADQGPRKAPRSDKEQALKEEIVRKRVVGLEKELEIARQRIDQLENNGEEVIIV